MKVGVLALQGAFREHEQALKACGCDTVQVKKAGQLEDIKGLIIPGGESTTIGKLLVDFDIMEPLRKKIEQGMPVFGTCAGMIVLAKEIVGSNQPRLGVMDIVAKRNAFGRQVDSFEIPLKIAGFDSPFTGVFIRAPYLESVGSDVEVLAEVEGKIVFARQNNLLAAAFHPELTDDLRIHKYFLNMVE